MPVSYPQLALARWRGFARWLTIVAVAGLAMRICFVVFAKPGLPLSGDPWFYFWQGYFTVHGRPFVDPMALDFFHTVTPGSDHPPLTSFVEAVADFYGVTSFFSHQIIWCLIGTGTVALVGVLARDLAGDRAGVLAAFLAAVYPGLWINDGLVQSETLAQFLVVAALLTAYRFWRRPRAPVALALGALIGLEVMCRTEDVVLWPLLAIPLVVGARDRSAAVERGPLLDVRAWNLVIPSRAALGWRERALGIWRSATTWGTDTTRTSDARRLSVRVRLALAVVVLAGSSAVVLPWVVHNTTTFSRTEILSTQFGRTLLGANCNATYYGDLLGYWSYQCQLAAPAPAGDQSVSDAFYRKEALNYISHHKSRLPAVVYARLARTWGFFDPAANLGVDAVQQRPYWASVWQLIMYFAMLPSILGGLLMLRRRRIPVYPLLAPALSVTAAAVVTYGTTRFRATAEPSLVVLAAIAELGWSRRLAGSRRHAARSSTGGRALAARLFRSLVGMPDAPLPEDDGSPGVPASESERRSAPVGTS